jgi:hypothetical protein
MFEGMFGYVPYATFAKPCVATGMQDEEGEVHRCEHGHALTAKTWRRLLNLDHLPKIITVTQLQRGDPLRADRK